MSARACVEAEPQAPVVDAPGVELDKSTEQPEERLNTSIKKVDFENSELKTKAGSPERLNFRDEVRPPGCLSQGLLPRNLKRDLMRSLKRALITATTASGTTETADRTFPRI
jgi:hypothetical protein